MSDIECSHTGCKSKATETTRLWLIKPSNVSDKPVCWFHYKLRNTVDEYTPYFLLPVAFTCFILLPFSSMISVVASFLISIILTPILMILIPEILHRLYMNDISLVRTNITEIEEDNKDNICNCTSCQKQTDNGTWREVSRNIEVFGIPIKNKKKVQNFYCQNCYEEIYNNENTNCSDQKKQGCSYDLE